MDIEDFIKGQGLPFLPHLLRRLSDEFVRGFGAWGAEAGMKAPPRTHSTMRVLSSHGPLGVTQVAAMIRQSHPLVITWVRQLKALGFIESCPDPADGRRTALSLTDAGRADLVAQEAARAVLARAFRALMVEADAEIFDGLWRIEEACRREPLLDRLRREQQRFAAGDPPAG